eukprot:g9302.t1
MFSNFNDDATYLAPGMALPPYIRQDQGGQASFGATRPRRPSTSSASNECRPRSPHGNLVGFGRLQDQAHLHHPQPVRVRFGEHDDRIEAGELDADAGLPFISLSLTHCRGVLPAFQEEGGGQGEPHRPVPLHGLGGFAPPPLGSGDFAPPPHAQGMMAPPLLAAPLGGPNAPPPLGHPLGSWAPPPCLSVSSAPRCPGSRRPSSSGGGGGGAGFAAPGASLPLAPPPSPLAPAVGFAGPATGHPLAPPHPPLAPAAFPGQAWNAWATLAPTAHAVPPAPAHGPSAAYQSFAPNVLPPPLSPRDILSRHPLSHGLGFSGIAATAAMAAQNTSISLARWRQFCDSITDASDRAQLRLLPAKLGIALVLRQPADAPLQEFAEFSDVSRPEGTSWPSNPLFGRASSRAFDFDWAFLLDALMGWLVLAHDFWPDPTALRHSMAFSPMHPPLDGSTLAPPAGTVSKDGSSLRLTVDLSAGGPRSTNASTPKLFTDFVQWKSLAGAVRVAHAGSKQGSGRLPFLLKLDVAKAFRKVPIRLADLHLTILEWEGRDEASELSSLLTFLSARYGFEFKLEKLEGPCHALTCIGWSFDLSPSLAEPTVSIPPGKKERFAHSAVATLSCPSGSGLDKLLGKLFNFASVFPVLRPAALRVCSHRHSLPESGTAKHIPFPLPAEIKEDIVSFASLPPTSLIQRCYKPSDLSQSSADIWIKSDAGSSFGQGFVVLKGPWLSDSAIDWGYRPHLVTEREAAFGKTSLCSAVVEAFVPSTAVRALSHKLAGRSVFFELDNEAAVLCLETGVANSPALDTAVKAARAAFSALGCIVRFSHIPLFAQLPRRRPFKGQRYTIPKAGTIRRLVSISIARSRPGHLAHQLVPAVVDLIIACISKSSRVTCMTGIRHFWSFLTFFNLQHDAFPVSATFSCSSLLGSSWPSLAEALQSTARAEAPARPPSSDMSLQLGASTSILISQSKHSMTPARDGFKVGVGVRSPVQGARRLGHSDLPLWVNLLIPASKTDYMRTGSYVRLWRNNSETCPFSRLLAAWHAATDKRPTAPLFQASKGNALSYKWLQKVLRSLVKAVGLDPSLYSSHSLRIGGATSLAMAGESADAIKHIGTSTSSDDQRKTCETDSPPLNTPPAEKLRIAADPRAPILADALASCHESFESLTYSWYYTEDHLTSPHASPDKVAEGPLIIKFPPAHRYRNVTVDKGGFSPTHVVPWFPSSSTTGPQPFFFLSFPVLAFSFHVTSFSSPLPLFRDPRTGEGFQRSFRSWLFPAAPFMTANLVCDFSRPCLASFLQCCLSFLHQLSTGDYFQFDFPFSLAARFSASSLCGRVLLASPFASLHSSSS